MFNISSDRIKGGVTLGAALVACLGTASLTSAQQVPWDHPDGTTHWYEPVAAQTGITWAEASNSATQAGGYLVTITSPEENEFVFSLVDSSVYWYERQDGSMAGPWTGGVQPPESPEPGNNWQWASGEPFIYSNWSPDEPDEKSHSDQNRIHFGEVESLMLPTWDDINEDSPDIRGYVIERASLTRTVGLFLNEEGSFDGYTLFAPLQYGTTYLIDNRGRLVNSWVSDYTPGNSVYLLENGNLLRTASLGPGANPTFNAGGAGGRIEELSWDGSLVWDFEYSSEIHLQHHDIERLPSGNVLLIAWEYKSAAEAIAAGRDPDLISDGELWADHIIEVEPDGKSGGYIVWEWHVWDHLVQDFDPSKENYGVVEESPELIDINFMPHPGADWNHTNSIDYNQEFDQILVSVPTFREIWVIDHSTTTGEAVGHSGGQGEMGGDILYRWGNPQAYRAGDDNDQKFFVEHDARWIETGYPGEGDILVFNNGQRRPDGTYSSVDEIVPPVDEEGHYFLDPGTAYGPDEPLWTYTAEHPADFYSSFISGAHRLVNGNTLICDGPGGRFFEVTSEGETVWLYINPVTDEGPLMQGNPVPGSQNGQMNSVFRASRYGPDFPGFSGKDLTPGDPIEIYPPTGISGQQSEIPWDYELHQNYPNPFNPRTVITYQLPGSGQVELKVYDLMGHEVKTLVDEFQEKGSHSVTWEGTNDRGEKAGSGVYFYRLITGDTDEVRKMLLLR